MLEEQKQSRRRVDVFAVLLAIFVLGLGAYLSTFSAEIVRIVGLALMAVAVVGLLVWFAWEHLTPATWTPEGKVAGGKLRSAFAALLLCGFLACGYIASHWKAPFFPFWHQTEAPKPPAPVPPPLVPAKPWVTAEEIDVQRKLGHALVNYSPGEILQMEIRNEDYKAYVGEWVKIDYQFVRLLPVGTKRRYLVVETAVDATWVGTRAILYAYFDPAKWESHLMLLRPNDRVRAFCQFDRIERSVWTQYFNTTLYNHIFVATNCTLS